MIKRVPVFIIGLLVLLMAAVGVFAAEATVTGLWQYEEIVTVDAQASQGEGSGQGVLLADLEAMPLDMLGKVFGKLSYTAEFKEDGRFAIEIAVLYLRFHAQGEWSVRDGGMTLVYDGITGFEKLWWLGGFDHLTHCDAEHTLTETVAYEVSENRLTFFSNGANLVFTK